MSELFVAAFEIDAFLRQKGWNYCLIGGVAVSRWGEPRTTQDVDICLHSGLGDEHTFIAPLIERFRSRISNATEFAERNRVLLLSSANGIGIDVSLAWTPFEEKMLARAAPYQLAPGIALPTASAEDLIVTKAFASRPQDWLDVRGILARQRDQLDLDYIRRELSFLCELKEAPEIVEELDRLRAEIDAE